MGEIALRRGGKKAKKFLKKGERDEPTPDVKDGNWIHGRRRSVVPLFILCR
jgi:hypothetical protein